MNARIIAEAFHGIPHLLNRDRGLAQVLSLVKFAEERLPKLNVRADSGDGEDDGDEEGDGGLNLEWRDFYPMRDAMRVGADGIARISVKGMLTNGLPGIYEKLGLATRYTTISADIDAAVAVGAKGLLFAIDSGGGSTVGGREVVQQIRALQIPTASHTASLKASAAYHIGASTGQVFATESAMVGSIGSILVMYDWSKFFQDYGVEPVVFASGDLKGTGVDGTSLTDAQKEYLQGLVDTCASAFKADVLADRGEVAEDSMRGQVFFSPEACERNIIDAIASEAEVRDWLVAQAA